MPSITQKPTNSAELEAATGQDVTPIFEVVSPVGSAIDALADEFSEYLIDQGYEHLAEQRIVVTTIPIRKPDKQPFFRTHPKHFISVLLLKDQINREVYVASREVGAQIPEEVVPTILHLTITRQGTVFFWPIKLPGPDGRLDQWNLSAHQAALAAQTNWVRLLSDLNIGAYTYRVPVAVLPEPEWPNASLNELIELAFRGRRIDNLDHPVLRQLRGEV